MDLYAGVGLFSLPLARRFRTVTAVESAASAVRDLEFNAARASLGVRPAEPPPRCILEELEQPPDFVLADPPRAGLGKAVVRATSPAPAAAADHRRLRPRHTGPRPRTAGSGRLRIERVTLIDLFPQTFHIETVVHLRRASSS